MLYASNLIGAMAKPNQIPSMPASMEVEQAIKNIIPSGFEDMISTKIDEDKNIILVFANSENQSDVEVEIPKILFNPGERGASFPKFLFQISTLRKADYFGMDSGFVLNNNQMLHMIIQNRCVTFKRYSKYFIGILRSDLKDLKSYIEYVQPNSFNAKKKVQNSFVVVDPWDRQATMYSLSYHKDNGVELPIGDILRPDGGNFYRKSIEQLMPTVMRDVQIQPGSENMLAESNKIIIASHDKEFYRAPGFVMKQEGNNTFIYSIFAGKQNVPSRLKTHLIADAFEFLEPDKKTLIQQDSIKVGDSIVPKDNCLAGGFIVFTDIIPETGQFVCGEIEQSIRTARRQVKMKEIREGQFQEVLVKVGEVHTGQNISLKIAIDADGRPVNMIGEYKRIEIVSIENDSIHNSYRIIMSCVCEAGCARITSHSGLKGFTKVRPELGYITLPNGEKRPVDFIAGMNAVKGKQNTIALSRACLALKEGFFSTPNGFLDSLNQKQVNDAASSIGKLKYTDEKGNVREVWAGYIQYSVTEVSRMYSMDRRQSFSFEAGKYLSQQEDSALFRHIFDNYIDPDMKEIVLELHKILTDDIGYHHTTENLPVWQPKDLVNVFKDSDLVLNSLTRWPSSSVLLDEEINKGWYLDLSYMRGPIVRMPSAKLLNAFCSHLPNGKYVYPSVVVNVSKVIENCIRKNAQDRYNFGFLWSEKENRRTSISQYIKSIRGMLHSEKEIGMVLSQTLVKPRIFGMNAKQMADITIPKGVVVILDNLKYWHMVEVANGLRTNEGRELKEVEGSEAVYANATIASLTEKGELPKGLIIRNPMLWRSQVQKVDIWDKQRYADYLMKYFGIELDSYMSVAHCRNMILISVADCIIQHSDLDGDLLPLFVPGPEGQNLLKDFYLQNLDSDEVSWTVDYYYGECEANDDLHADSVYQLNKIQVNYDLKNKKTYSEFFINAAVAKNNIGSATSDIWTLYGILQLYQKFCNDPELNQKFIAEWRRRVPSSPKTLLDVKISKMSYLYTRLVEEYVINAIKHMEGGSSSFTMFYLKNMTASEDNATKVASKLASDEFKMDRRMVSEFMDIIRWSVENGLMDAMKNYIRKYNKGKEVPVSEFDPYISDFTFFGQLTEPLNVISKEIAKVKASNWSYRYSGFVPWTGSGQSVSNVPSLPSRYAGDGSAFDF